MTAKSFEHNSHFCGNNRLIMTVFHSFIYDYT